MGRGLTFFADEWAVIGDRPIGLGTFLRPFNEHWLGVMTLVHRAMVEVIGIGTYMPYLALLAALHVVVIWLVYVLVRRRTHPLIAVGVTAILAIFGSGFENLFWAMQIGFIGAIALGLGALLVLEQEGDGQPSRRRIALAVAMLTLGVMTSGFGLFMLVLVGLDVVLDRGRWRVIPPLVIPGLVYVAWYVTLGRQGLATYGDPFTIENLSAVPRFVFEGAAEAFSSALGVGRALGRFVVIGLAVALTVSAVRRVPIPGRALACFGAIVAMYALLGLVRANLDADATYYSRYSYLSGMFALMGLAALIGRRGMPEARPRRQAVVVGLIAVFALSVVWNARLLVAGRALFGERADLTRAMVELGLSEPLPEGVDPDLSLVLVPSPVRLEAIIAALRVAADGQPCRRCGRRRSLTRHAQKPSNAPPTRPTGSLPSPGSLKPRLPRWLRRRRDGGPTR